ncbi:MAG TPA: M4 family metallopeptidase [Phycisphaerae bacterium]|nr:M4 family metallopeptidase [Phycisphaerae bacterium]HRW54323.1 M4 family metallopeptidase [Phycisphaerae bacterium]
MRVWRRALVICAIVAMAPIRSRADASDAHSPANERSIRVVRSHRLGQPILLQVTDDAMNVGASPDDLAAAFPDIGAEVFSIRSPAVELERRASAIDQLGRRHDRYVQRLQGIPVFSGELSVHYRKDGALHAITGRFYPIPASLKVTPLLSIDDALGAFLATRDGELDVFESELTIVDPGWYGDPSIGAHLAYRFTLASRHGQERLGVFVDANTGQTLDEWSMMCGANERRIYSGAGQSALPGVLARDELDPATGAEDIDEAYDYIGDALAFFQNAFGRNGIDDAGAEIIATVNANDIGQFPCPNAAFDFVRKQMIFCNGATADDVVAHEFAHGVTAYSANLIYQNQAGQLNESFSDVFGELVDLYNGGAEIAGAVGGTPWTAHASGPGLDTANNARTLSCSFAPGLFDGVRWLIGEDALTMNGPFRDMWTPNCFLHPQTANDPFQTCSLVDNGGVHSGSGVPNHAFAMLCDGKTFNSVTINPIGPAKAAAVWYRALTTYLTVGSDFQDAYLALNLAAADLVGVDPNDPRTGLPTGDPFTAADALEVDKALIAVEMNTPGACGESEAPLDSAAPILCEQADVVFFDDFESGPGAWTLSNSAPPTPYDWELVGELPFDRPGTAWFIEDRNVGVCGETSEAGVHDLTSPLIQTPVDFDTLTLEFVHFIESEPRFDGGLLELRINEGPWLPTPQSLFRYNACNISLFQMSQGSQNPLAGRIAFSGVGGQWGRTVIDLADLVAPGDTIRLRFRFGKDDCYGLTGWWVDDVRISACRSSADCNANGRPDEIDRAQGPAPRRLLDQPINLRATANLSDLDPHPTLGPHKVVEDFTLLRPARITRVRVRGGYDDDNPTTDDFTVEVFADDNGLPGTLIAAYPSVTSTRQATGNIFFSNDEYAYELSLPAPLSLAAGDYMIGVYNNTSASPGTWRWGRAWFGWTPGAAFFGQGCNWCRIDTANFAIEVLGDTIGRGKGDLNADGDRTLQDVSFFVSVLLTGPQDSDQACAADMNADDVVDGRDIDAFVGCILTSDCDDQG